MRVETSALRHRYLTFTLVLLMTALAKIGHHGCYASREDRIERALIKALFQDYDSESRPVSNLSEPVLVEFGLAYSNLQSLDEKNQVLTSNVWIRQRWSDPWLSWNSSQYGGLSSVNLSPNLLWKPDIVLYNNVNEEGDHGEQYLFDTKVIVSSDGTVTWFSPNLIKSSCKINVKYFPFDTQTCKLTFGSWSFHGFKMDLNFFDGLEGADLATFTLNGEWEILSMEGQKTVLYYSCCPEPYPDLTFHLKIKRRTLFYLNNLIIPCIVLVVLTATSFLFPPESGERISLVITILLGMTVFMIVFTEAIPSTSEVTPLVSAYFSAVMIEISLGLVCTCISLNLLHHHPKLEIKGWLRYILFDVTGPVLSYFSVKSLKHKQFLNKNVKSLEESVNENHVAVEENKGIVLEDHNNVKNVEEKEVKVAGMEKVTKYIDRVLLEERRKTEWHVAINIIDNFFFVLFMITIIISSLAFLTHPGS